MSILAIPFPTYQPAMRIISNITNANPATVTTTFNHQYQTGLIMRINIPPGYGMQEINQLYAPIIVTGLTTFTIAINTLFMSAYSAAASFPDSYQSATVTPVGNINLTTTNLAVQNVLPYQGM